MTQDRITLSAPAKVNLHLSVVGRRADGYHLLETLMVKLELSDRLTLSRRAEGVTLEVPGGGAPENPDNLAYRAAESFFHCTGIEGGVGIRLEKRIPAAAGLGGGSSDAAAVLTGLNRLYDGPLSTPDLLGLGLNLGADVPFFIRTETALWAEGIGERFHAVSWPGRLQVLLVNPGWPLSTAWVFKNYKLELTTRRRNHIFSGLYESSFTIGRELSNDLESVVLPNFPEVMDLKNELKAAGARGVLMSGSGPTVYGLFDDLTALQSACDKLMESGGDKRLVLPTRTI